MKTLVEFGKVGGPCSQIVCTSTKQGNELAAKLVYVLGNHTTTFKVGGSTQRETWTDHTHYVGCSKIGTAGYVATELWRR